MTSSISTPTSPKRAGRRDGGVSELTVIAPLKPGGADRLRAGIHAPNITDFIVQHQLTADAWYVAVPEATVADVRRGQKVRIALENCWTRRTRRHRNRTNGGRRP